ncbi:MAG TPA: hypothetical protein VEQ17_12320, partial [Steroidobacteraceae bacterium]|nr:hypothetical protein [Steroidobacteraceae bacterium]
MQIARASFILAYLSNAPCQMDIAQPIPSPGLSEASEHDAAGRHGDAFNTLKQAAAAGDLPAMTELGHRLLTGYRAPKMVDHALSLLTAAARGGDGRALARMAALTAAGAYVPQDWAAALHMLALGAAAGDAGARGQLLSLHPVSPEQVEDWPALAARISVQDWLSPAPVS